MLRRYLVPLLIILIAFTFRVSALDDVRHEFDRSYPHGLAIETLESIQDGHYQDPAPRFYISTIGLPNPLATVVLYMLVALFERSAFIATAISAMLNIVAVAMTFNLTRRLFGRSPAIVAALLMATSPWSVYISRGAYVQGFLEFGAVASAWLLFLALKLGKPRQLLASFVATAIMMQTYAVALALAGQAVAACMVTPATTRKFIKVVAIGMGLLILAIAIQTIPFFLIKYAALPTPDPIAALGANYGQSSSIANPFGLHLNLGALDHSLRLVSGRDFENELLNAVAPEFDTQQALGDGRAGLIDALVVVGVIIAIARSRRDSASRMVLAWLLLPIFTATALMMVFKSLQTTYYYMTITAPAGYILAGLPFMALDRLRQLHWSTHTRRVITGAVSMLVGLAGVAQVSISAWHLQGHASNIFNEPLPTMLPFAPLRWQKQLGDAWRTNCRQINDAFPHYWMVSTLETRRILRDGVSRATTDSEVWAVNESGGNCTLRLGSLAPAFAETIPVRFNDQITVTLYRSSAISTVVPSLGQPALTQSPTLKEIPGAHLYQMLQASAPLRVNLNWTLLDLATTPQSHPGEYVTVTQVMRIDALPNEPYQYWYFAPFVSLQNAQDNVLLTIDNAVALEGSKWQVGDIVISSVRVRVPDDTPPGAYQLKMTLFDPNQKKNAIFFAPDAEGKPIIDLLRPLTIVGPNP